MKLERISLWIKWIGRSAALLGVVALLVVADGFMDGADRTAKIFSGYPGMSQPISGKSSKRIKSIEQLSYTASSKEITLRFTNTESSVWYNIWYGILEFDSSAQPGDHTLSVSCEAEIPEKRITQYKIRVYKDISTYESHLRSYIRRHWGVSPWWIFLGILPILVFSFAFVYHLSGRKASLMAASGHTEIYRLKRSGEDWLLSFGLGSEHGVKQGDIVPIYAPDGASVGTAKVQDVFPTHSVAIAHGWQKIKPDYEVRLRSAK
ncbi:MAG: hypothetical protein IMF11_19885 [Proteobacteria bacterium]|nr:hypothetical protein [Pseudomonadota bacterium]